MNLREKLIVLVDNDCIKKSDAIILLEGDGLNRIPKAVELYLAGFAHNIVFSGGIVNLTYGSFPFSMAYPELIHAGIPSEVIIHESKSQNTREQAIEIVKLAILKDWKKLILVASHYHQYRAYLTFIKEIADTKSNILLYNAPAKDLKWFEETGWGNRYDLLDSEFDRIEKYTELSHLSTIIEAIEYQRWKEQQA
jgi:uncharacterized SAM-binding protein YcdF (DUF218 family)